MEKWGCQLSGLFVGFGLPEAAVRFYLGRVPSTVDLNIEEQYPLLPAELFRIGAE